MANSFSHYSALSFISEIHLHFRTPLTLSGYMHVGKRFRKKGWQFHADWLRESVLFVSNKYLISHIVVLQSILSHNASIISIVI
jgi:hypothetical protein